MNILINILLIIIGVLLFGLAIFIHELGHFLAAKLSGIRVNEFALGMGPRIFGFRRGETQYTLRAFPIGGFCDMSEDDEADENDERAFQNKPVWKRIIVIVAGGFMNIVYGLILMLIITSTQPVFATTTIAELPEESAFALAGMELDDKITKIDNYSIYSSRDLSFQLSMLNPEDTTFVVERNGEKLKLEHMQLDYEQDDDGRNIVQIDFKVYGEARTLGTVLSQTFTDTFSMARMVIESLKGLIGGKFSLNDMAGPIGTAQIITEAASSGLMEGFGTAVANIVMIICLITVNLGIINLLPLPALDGGRLLFLLVELIFRKPVPQKYESVVHAVGFVILIGFMVVVAFNDIVRIVSG